MTNKFNIEVETDLNLWEFRSRMTEKLIWHFLELHEIDFKDFESIPIWKDDSPIAK